MRSSFRNLVPLLFASVLAAPLALAGCQSQAPSQATTQAAPPDDSYIQWEHETHREHVDVDKRSADERKQYDDWHRSHPDHH
jgi:hypothetical protein